MRSLFLELLHSPAALQPKILELQYPEGTKEAAEETGAVVTDASITAAVKMKMADDEMVKARNIDVDTKDGVVTLNGTVGSKAEEQKAIDLANTVDGVKRVVSNLTVSS